MNAINFPVCISLAWILASPLVIYRLVKTARSDPRLIAVVTIVGAAYLLTVTGAAYIAYEAFAGSMSDALNNAFFFLIVISPIWVLISPFVIYKLFKAKRPVWACVVILMVVGAIVMDYDLIPAILRGLAAAETFRN